MVPRAPRVPEATFQLNDAARLHALDILRGLALCGMILVHFHQHMRREVTGVEDLIPWAVWVLLEQKAWGTFAVLFGAGFALLLRRLEARGDPVVPIFLRRLATLALFGLVAELGFGFHILVEYALLGGVLLLVRRWPSRALLALAALSVCARPLFAAIAVRTNWPVEAVWTPAVREPLVEAVAAAARQADYATLFAARWRLFAGAWPRAWFDLLPTSNLALFILGLLAVRHRLFDEPKRHLRVILCWMMFGLLSWGFAWTVTARNPLLQDQWLCFTYMGAVVLLLAHRPVWMERLRFFGQAGRMALTNYMLQAIVLDVLGSGYGFGLRLQPTAYVATSALLFSAEAAFSRFWLSHHRFGPLEWLWRSATYARPVTARASAIPRR